jgi:aryl-alcohol dehydrogenase-like predicted oxidoreductase
MEYRVLGRTGIHVSPFCLGAMMFGAWGNTDHDDCARIVHRALDAGINFIDTADVYSAGESEEIVGKALASVDRSQVVLATKVHSAMGPGPNQRGNSRRWIVAEVEQSLRRLGTDYIDLYQLHRHDESTDLDETLGALTDLVRAGKIRAFGGSTFQPATTMEAAWVSDRRGHGRLATEQPPYSILVRWTETELLPTCQQLGMGVLSWGPLAGGWLAGGWGRDKDNRSSRAHRIANRYDLSLPVNQRKLDVVDALAGIADEAGLRMLDLALGFVLEHPAVTSAIIGPRTYEQLEEQLPVMDQRVPADVLDAVDQVVPPGTTVSYLDVGYDVPSLRPDRRRRP